MSDQTRTTNRRTSYGSVLADREYRVILAAGGLSWIGDYLARAAVTLLVYDITGSVTQSAVTFAISYLPWIVGGPVLAALAERYPHRRVMVFCDVARAFLVAAVAIDGMPIWGIWLLLFFAALLNPPFEASRAALLTRIFSDDKFVLAQSLWQMLHQVAVLVGYGPGPALAAYAPRGALVIDAATFLTSAVLVGTGLRPRPVERREQRRQRLLVETVDGFRYILRSPVLRAVALVVLLVVTVTTVPEGLAAAWASQMAHPIGGAGISQALIMGANPVGHIVGSVATNRFIGPERRARILPALAVLGPLALVPALWHPNALIIAGCAMVSGVALAGIMPNAIGIFARVVRLDFRTRTFGVMQTSVQISQAAGVLVAGTLAGMFDLPTVVGLWSLAGALAALLACLTIWPGPQRVRAAAELAGADVEPAGETGVGGAEPVGDLAARVPQQERTSQPDRGRPGQHRAGLSGATTIDG